MSAPIGNILPQTGLTLACVRASLEGVPVQNTVKFAGIHYLSALLGPQRLEKDRLAYEPYSRLTPTGFPVEVAFGTPKDELRLTTEVGGPNVAAARRLDLAIERLHDIGCILGTADLAWCRAMQKGADLVYGAWASIRVQPNAHAFKLYSEVPLQSHDKAVAQLSAPGDLASCLTDRGARVTMVGLPSDSDPEFYFGVNGLRLDELPALYRRLGMPSGGNQVIEAIEAVQGRFVNRAAAIRQVGLSLRQVKGRAWIMSVFCQADDLFASGSATRRALLRAAPQFGCDFTGYEEFSRDAEFETDANRHCMLAFTPLRNGRLDLRVGLSPTPPPATDQLEA